MISKISVICRRRELKIVIICLFFGAGLGKNTKTSAKGLRLNTLSRTTLSPRQKNLRGTDKFIRRINRIEGSIDSLQVLPGAIPLRQSSLPNDVHSRESRLQRPAARHGPRGNSERVLMHSCRSNSVAESSTGLLAGL